MPVPSGATPDVARQIAAAANEVFSGGYVAAMHGAMVLPITAVLLGAACGLLAKRRQPPAPAAPAVEEQPVASEA